MEPSLKRQKWLTWVAALAVLLILFYSVQSWWAAAVFIGAVALLMALRRFRVRAPERPSMRCLNCGEAMNPNARECASCGSTRWTIQ